MLAVGGVYQPHALIQRYPLSETVQADIHAHRQQIADTIHQRDERWLVVVGPCSIHDELSALAYAEQLQALSRDVQDVLKVVMRVYFEKPRTARGWCGYLYDPHLDGSMAINTGLERVRRLLLAINDMGLAVATEFVNPLTTHYFADLIAWAAVGARTVESQLHRHVASTLAMPVGFKNSTSGNVQVAIDAQKIAQQSQAILTIDEHEQVVAQQSKGNPNTQLILRGSEELGPNYNEQTVTQIQQRLQQAQLSSRLLIDCSHGNSGKDHVRQQEVAAFIIERSRSTYASMGGIMLESFLQAGKQMIGQDLQFGQSITDPCLDWSTTQQLIEALADELRCR